MNYSKNRLWQLQLCLNCAVFLLPTMLFAESYQVDSHAHGVAELNVAVDGSSVAIEYISPAMNITGFEHAATLPSEVQAVEGATSVLLSDRLFALPGAADCKLTDASRPNDDESDDDHTEGHESHQDHSEFHVVYQYECSDPSALEYIDVKIFTLFPGNERINAQAVSAGGQTGAELTAASSRLELP